MSLVTIIVHNLNKDNIALRRKSRDGKNGAARRA